MKPCARCSEPKLSLDAQGICCLCRCKEVTFGWPRDWTLNSPDRGKQLELF